MLRSQYAIQKLMEELEGIRVAPVQEKVGGEVELVVEKRI
jgi:hypothetical protein